ncbi:hypothetical protein PYCC9005_000210 [Savitreella phatthalungensis]
MSLALITQTLTTTHVPIDADLIIAWRDCTAKRRTESGQAAGAVAPLGPATTPIIDATPLKLDQVIAKVLAASGRTALVGLDVLLAQRRHSAARLLALCRGLASQRKHIVVVLNADTAVRQDPEHEYFLQQILHSATEPVISIRAIPSGRDKDFAGMARVSRPSSCKDIDDEGERLVGYV